jgi:hypothetical protein
MSEFSDSYHLHTSDPTQAAKLLRDAKRYGAVLPTTTPFVPFLVDGRWEAGGVVAEILAHNVGLLVHYAYAEDHGLWIRTFDKDSCVATIDIQRRRTAGDDVPDPGITTAALTKAGAVAPGKARQLETVLQHARVDAEGPLRKFRDEIVTLLGLSHVSSLSCADLAYGGEKELLRRFPGATFVLKSRRGQADKEREKTYHEANEWCPRPGLPACMYLEVPDGQVDESMLARHVEHWLTTADWDGAAQSGFWLYTAYERALPARMRFLAHRIMNLQLAFDASDYREALERTIRGVLAVTPRDFDWEPYLARRKGEQRL